ncbi:MAG: hypothetical protein IMZ62_12020 [Chloroflexi bacterium]|nr:hypothetical protein [Chloroflexota bacterium]
MPHTRNNRCSRFILRPLMDSPQKTLRGWTLQAKYRCISCVALQDAGIGKPPEDINQTAAGVVVQATGQSATISRLGCRAGIPESAPIRRCRVPPR